MRKETQEQINITEVIARIRTGADGGSFVLTGIYSQGKKKGLKYRHKCRYGAPVQAIHKPTSKRADVFTEVSDERRHVENGTLPMTNLDAHPARYFEPLISHLVGYNHFLIRH